MMPINPACSPHWRPGLFRGKSFFSSQPVARIVNGISLFPRLISAFILLAVALSIPALGSVTEYGRSTEDLIGVFSIEKTIRIGGSSQDLLPGDEADPLSPPRSLYRSLADDQAPSLAGLSIEPQSIPVNSSQPVNISLHAIDDQAFHEARASFSGPGELEAVALFPASSISSGSIRDGWYYASVILPSNQTGVWRLESLTLADRDGNERELTGEELKKRGFPVLVLVVRPDASILPAGIENI